MRHLFCWLAWFFFVLPAMAANEVFYVDNLTYVVIDSVEHIVSVGAPKKNITKDITIPEKVEHNGIEYSVNHLLDNAFRDCTGSFSVTIPPTFKAIGSRTFENCSGIISVVLPESIVYIGDKAFYGSSLESINIPNSVTGIGNSAFRCCPLRSIEIPNSVTSIGSFAFSSCFDFDGLKSVIIPNSVTYVGGAAFGGTDTLYYGGDAIATDWGAKHLIRGSVFDGDFVYRDEQKTILVAYRGSDSVVTISDSITSIDENVFNGFETVCYAGTASGSPWGAKRHIKRAFIDGDFIYADEAKTQLAAYLGKDVDVIIPNSVTSIDAKTFNGFETVYYTGTASGSPWSAKKHIKGNVIDEGFVYADESKTKLVVYIGTDSVVTIPNSVTTIGNNAFKKNTNMTSVIIPTSVTSIGDSAFYNCTSLTSVTIPDSVISIGKRAFYECTSLTSVTIPNSIKSIEAYTFCFCYKLASVIIPDSITSIGSYAFYNCSELKSVNIPNSVTSIGSYAFYDCSELTSVIIQNSVTSIGSSAFYNVDSIYYGGISTGSPWGAKHRCYIVDGDFTYADLGKESLLKYTGSDSVVIIPDQVKIINDSAFYNNTEVAKVTIPESVTNIGKAAFYGIDAIDYYGSATGSPWGAKRHIKGTIFDGDFVYADEEKTKLVAYLGENAIVIIPNSVTSIDANTFNGSETVYYAGTATGSPWGAKEHIKGYIDGDYIYTDEGKTKIAVYTGSDSVVVIPEQVKTIGDNVFNGNTKLISVTLPDSIISIGNNAFSGCTGISSLTIPVSVTSIGNNAFSGIDTIYYQTENGTILIIKDFHVIHNLQEFLTYRDINNKGYHPNGRLDADIDLSPICGIINGEIVNWETLDLGNAMFDGGNHTISNLYINKPGYKVSLFKSWHVENLTVKNAYVKGTDAAGITFSEGAILRNCHFKGVVVGSRDAGGLNLYGKGCFLINCSNYGLVVGGEGKADGICAQEPINCYNRGKIVCMGGTAKGIGMSCCCNPENCYNAAVITKPGYSIYEAYKSCFNLKIEGINLFDGENVQQMDSSAFLSGAVTDSLNKYVAQYPKTYTYYAGTIEDTIPLLPWVQGEDGFPRFEGVNLQPTQGYIVRFTGKVNNIDVSLDGTIDLPVCPVDGCTYVFSNDFDGKNIVSDTTVAVSQITDPNFLERDDDGFYLIHNGAELAKFRDVVNEGAVAINGRLANDIDLSQECKDSVWIPIGVYKNRGDYIAFEGVFDGAGHSIEHLYDIDSPDKEGIHWDRGLFGNTKNATIQNVVVKNSRITGYCVSAIVASAENTTILNCGSEAELYGYSDYGAASMLAYGEGTLKVMNCYNLGVVGSEWQAAAIASYNHGTSELENCYSSALITWDKRYEYPQEKETGPFCQVERCVRCFTDSVICNYDNEREGVTKTSTDYIKSDAFLADMNAWVDSMNAAQSEIVFARWVRDEVDGYPKLQPTHTSVSLPDVRRTTPDGISVYAVDGTIYIRSAHAGKATLYDLHGKAVASVAYTEGLTTVDGLREGVYIVCGVKVIVRRGK